MYLHQRRSRDTRLSLILFLCSVISTVIVYCVADATNLQNCNADISSSQVNLVGIVKVGNSIFGLDIDMSTGNGRLVRNSVPLPSLDASSIVLWPDTCLDRWVFSPDFTAGSSSPVKKCFSSSLPAAQFVDIAIGSNPSSPILIFLCRSVAVPIPIQGGASSPVLKWSLWRTDALTLSSTQLLWPPVNDPDLPIEGCRLEMFAKSVSLKWIDAAAQWSATFTSYIAPALMSKLEASVIEWRGSASGSTASFRVSPIVFLDGYQIIGNACLIDTNRGGVPGSVVMITSAQQVYVNNIKMTSTDSKSYREISFWNLQYTLSNCAASLFYGLVENPLFSLTQCSSPNVSFPGDFGGSTIINVMCFDALVSGSNKWYIYQFPLSFLNIDTTGNFTQAFAVEDLMLTLSADWVGDAWAVIRQSTGGGDSLFAINGSQKILNLRPSSRYLASVTPVIRHSGAMVLISSGASGQTGDAGWLFGGTSCYEQGPIDLGLFYRSYLSNSGNSVYFVSANTVDMFPFGLMFQFPPRVSILRISLSQRLPIIKNLFNENSIDVIRTQFILPAALSRTIWPPNTDALITVGDQWLAFIRPMPSDQNNGRILKGLIWITDGTIQGTQQLTDSSQVPNTLYVSLLKLGEIGRVCYFVVGQSSDTGQGSITCDLWAFRLSNALGSILIPDGACSYAVSQVSGDLSGKIALISELGISGRQFTTDGTKAGTLKVALPTIDGGVISKPISDGNVSSGTSQHKIFGLSLGVFIGAVIGGLVLMLLVSSIAVVLLRRYEIIDVISWFRCCRNRSEDFSNSKVVKMQPLFRTIRAYKLPNEDIESASVSSRQSNGSDRKRNLDLSLRDLGDEIDDDSYSTNSSQLSIGSSFKSKRYEKPPASYRRASNVDGLSVSGSEQDEIESVNDDNSIVSEEGESLAMTEMTNKTRSGKQRGILSAPSNFVNLNTNQKSTDTGAILPGAFSRLPMTVVSTHDDGAGVDSDDDIDQDLKLLQNFRQHLSDKRKSTQVTQEKKPASSRWYAY